MSSTKHILVTGGAGYIGSACTKALLDEGYNVTVIDNLSHGDKKYVDKRAEFIEADLRDKKALFDIFANNKFDTVMHFAAFKSVGQSEEQPEQYYENNIGGTINLLLAIGAHKVPEIVFSSSAAVYAPTQEGICNEESQLGSINVYGMCKTVEESLIKEFARTGKLTKYSILRYFNVAGDTGLDYVDPAPENVFPILARALSGGATFNIYGTDYDTRDGTCIRDYIHLSDLVDAHIKAMQSDTSGIWNLGTNQGTSVRELIAEFESVSDKKMNVQESPRRAGDPATLLADASKAEKELGWKPSHTLHEMVVSTLD